MSNGNRRAGSNSSESPKSSRHLGGVFDIDTTEDRLGPLPLVVSNGELSCWRLGYQRVWVMNNLDCLRASVRNRNGDDIVLDTMDRCGGYTQFLSVMI